MVGKTIASKLSVQTFGWTKGAIQEAVFKDKEKPVFLMRAAGVVSGLKPYKDKETGEVRYGSLGQFEVTGPDGSKQAGSVLYLPKYVQELIEAYMSGDNVTIRIAFDIYAEHNERSATSYAFSVNDLLQEGSQDLDSVNEVIKELPLPSGSAAPQIAAPKEDKKV